MMHLNNIKISTYKRSPMIVKKNQQNIWLALLIHYSICKILLWSSSFVIHTENPVIYRSGKIDLRPNTRTKWPGPIPDPTSVIGSLESGCETRIIPNPKFLTKLFIFTRQAHWTKNRLIRGQPEWNFTQPKPNRPEISSDIRNITRPVRKPMTLFARSSYERKSGKPLPQKSRQSKTPQQISTIWCY